MSIAGVYIAVALLSAVFVYACEFVPAVYAAVIYAAILCCLIAAVYLFERRRRRRLIERIERILDGEYRITAEDEASAIERRVMLMQASDAAARERIRQGYDNLASLVSDIAHQSKTPLSTIMVHAEALHNDPHADAIRSQTERLRFLIDALTKLSRCESGLISDNLSPKKSSVGTLIADAAGRIYDAAEAKSIVITADAPPDDAMFDPHWTSEALFNLLDNAVKYTPEGGRIHIAGETLDMFVRIDVTDSGIGIPEAELVTIWQRFYRGSGAAGVSGVGIGLYLTREIIQHQGGRVKAASDGCGSTFSIFLPKS